MIKSLKFYGNLGQHLVLGGGGAGWTGQPAIVKWPKELRESMNIYDEFKGKEDFTEVIHGSLDGNI